ncbi:MAG: hypothetical protein JXR96_03125 [Deltaproteobacteria bacterium]|nr:hypothetical protein [Deltaproteobacteria bacterium]
MPVRGTSRPDSDPKQRGRFVLMMVVRALVVTALFASTLFFGLQREAPGVSRSEWILYASVGCVYALTLGYLLWIWRVQRDLRTHFQVQVFLDVLLATLLVYLTGGIESPFTFFYTLPIINTAVSFESRGALLTAGLCCLMLGALFILEKQGILPVDLAGRVGERPSMERVVYLLVLNYAMFFSIAWLAGHLGAQLGRAGRKLLQAEREMRAMEASVERSERLAALGRMAAGIAHEIRNPLASISGSVQMLREAIGTERTEQRLMEIILRETQRLDGLLRDFLDYARPREPLARRSQLRPLVEQTVEAFSSQLVPGPRVDRELEDVEAEVDPEMIRRALWNLLSNAGQACGPEGRVTVSLRSANGRVQLAVADDGPGVEPEIRDRIFEPFFTTRNGGSGLGLATVSQIVEAHRGALRVDSPPGGGAVFEIDLPGVRHG